jgi:sulfatase maturation enzyme AslB (radical SAM superfamily)
LNLNAGIFPRRIEMELASACNLRCTYCPRKFVDVLSGFMEFSLFKRLIDEIAAYPETILVLHRRGESLLHPDFSKICDYIKGKFREVQIATNATLLNEQRAKSIINSMNFISFSIDAPEVFDKTRIPAKYASVEANILKFLDLSKGKLKTQVSMVKTNDTSEKNCDVFKKIWKGKVDRIRIYEEHSHDGRFGSLGRDRGARIPCVMPFYELLICCDGKIGRCNHDWNGRPIGDINKSTIRDIWNGGFCAGLRRQHITLKITDKVCKNCDSWYPEIGKQGTGEVND